MPVPGFAASLSSPAFSMAQMGCTAGACVAPLRSAGGPSFHMGWPLGLSLWCLRGGQDFRMGNSNNIII